MPFLILPALAVSFLFLVLCKGSSQRETAALQISYERAKRFEA